VFGLQTLSKLLLLGNALSGPFLLQLGENHLTGEIPREISRLQPGENHLTGEIPREISRLQNLGA
jgi:hypothetical protein